MSSTQQILLTMIGVLCIPLSLIILRVLFSRLFSTNKRWHRTGLWFFSLAYASLALGILGERFGLEYNLWIYLFADAAFVAAPCIILGSYALDRALHKRSEGAEQ